MTKCPAFEQEIPFFWVPNCRPGPALDGPLYVFPFLSTQQRISVTNSIKDHFDVPLSHRLR